MIETESDHLTLMKQNKECSVVVEFNCSLWSASKRTLQKLQTFLYVRTSRRFTKGNDPVAARKMTIGSLCVDSSTKLNRSFT